MKRILILTLLSSALFSAANAQEGDTRSFISPDFWGKQGIKDKIIRPKCLGCHSSQLSGAERNGAPEGSNFDTYDDAKSQASKIIQRAVVDMDMPPDPDQQLTDVEKKALQNWVKLGFPSTGISGQYSSTGILTLPKVYVLDAAGNAIGTAEAEMKVIKTTRPFQFEITGLKYTPINSSDSQ